ncbi:hypothetical protein FGM00_04885 [Aggregatimonas sangjinii]|uniref:Alginate export domain-containing protein n=1 Tax=Aggregatimonas sangjinii TaxID=2583587 RepID=A0A5B7SLZ1_9FLAO|nr:alginate export family protein [Aggregatimonas sangjinii]QCW99476.1 hypothetical protein FGM00_04885 [Aggregatimonas sangjinii]
MNNKAALTFFILGFFFYQLGAQVVNEPKPFAYGVLSQYDDFSFLRNVQNRNTYDKIKFIPFGENGSLSFGGSYRTQFEYFNDQDFIEGATDSWVLGRLMLHADVRHDNWQFFAQLNSSSIVSKENPSPVDRDELAFNQLFLKYDDDNWVFKVGRENLSYGSSRIISFREGPNVRRYFDGVNVIRRLDKIKLEAFYYQIVGTNPFAFDNDVLDGDEYIFGTYNTFSNSSRNQNLDIYYLKFGKDEVRYQQGTAEENRHSLGLRYFGNIHSKLSFNTEFLYQFGEFGETDISAWTASVNLAYKMALGSGNLTFDLKSEIISGDDNPMDNELNTFNALYPRGAYFGRIAQFGPANLIDVHPSLTYSTNKWTFFTDYVAFWRESTDDGIYGAGLNLSYEDLNDEQFIAHQVGAALSYNFSASLSFGMESNYLIRGDFIEASGLGTNTLHFLCEAQLKF